MSPCKGSSPSSPNTSFDSADSSMHHRVPPPFSSPSYQHPAMSPAVYTNNGPPPMTSTPYTNGVSSNPPVSNGTSWNSRQTPPMGVLKTRKKSGGGQPFDPDASHTRLNFTYRRELEKQHHEKQLIDNLRSVRSFSLCFPTTEILKIFPFVDHRKSFEGVASQRIVCSSDGRSCLVSFSESCTSTSCIFDSRSLSGCSKNLNVLFYSRYYFFFICSPS